MATNWRSALWLMGIAVILYALSVAAQAVELKPNTNAGELRLNELTLDVKGELRVMAEKQLQSLPMSVAATAKFTERRVDDGTLAGRRGSLSTLIHGPSAIGCRDCPAAFWARSSTEVSHWWSTICRRGCRRMIPRDSTWRAFSR